MSALALTEGQSNRQVGSLIALGLRLFQIQGNGYEPDLRGGSFLMIARCDRYLYETDYVFDFGDGECPYLAQRRVGGTIALRLRNPAYQAETVLTDQEFCSAVRGVVVAEVKVRDERLIREAQAHRVAA